MSRSFVLPVTIICIFFLATCIDPYYPELGGYQSLLVVEGSVTDEDSPATVRITKTFQSADSLPEEISDATVYITDENDVKTELQYISAGMYQTNALSGFKGRAGKIYTLHIETTGGEVYVSDPCVMYPVPGIDSVYFSVDEDIDMASNSQVPGIRIFIDTDATGEDEGYLRWEYEETWKFKLPSPKEFDYINDKNIIQLDHVREYCWKQNRSGGILVKALVPGFSEIKHQPLCFIPSAKSDRLTFQYSILVRQMSISQEEFSFWENLKQVNETTGNIFDTQPFPVISNIHNVSNPGKKTLGYFKVSAVREKRIFITAGELAGFDLPYYHYPCDEYIVSPETYVTPGGWGTPPTWDEINEMFMVKGGFVFVRPIYAGNSKVLSKLVFATSECSDCALTGDVSPPDFWQDL